MIGRVLPWFSREGGGVGVLSTKARMALAAARRWRRQVADD